MTENVLNVAPGVSIRHLPIAALIAIITTAMTLVVGPAIIHAQAVQVGIGFSLPYQDLTVGDPFPLTISAIHPEGHNIIFPRLPAEWGRHQRKRRRNSDHITGNRSSAVRPGRTHNTTAQCHNSKSGQQRHRTDRLAYQCLYTVRPPDRRRRVEGHQASG